MAPLRNAAYFALAMTVPGAVALFRVALPQSDTWGRGGWEAFAIVFPLYGLLYFLSAVVTFAVASMVSRRHTALPRSWLLAGGCLAGLVFLAVGYVIDPLWREREVLLCWVGIAAVFAFFILLRARRAHA